MPTIGAFVTYRTEAGYDVPAMIVAAGATRPEHQALGAVPDLSSDKHVHLVLFLPLPTQGGTTVVHDIAPADGEPTERTWR